MATLMVYEYEGRDVSIFYFPGAHLNADITDERDARLELEGEFVDIMCDVNPNHIPNVRYKN